MSANHTVIFSNEEIAEGRRTAVALITALQGSDPYGEYVALNDHAMTRKTHCLVRCLGVIAKQGIAIAAEVMDEPLSVALDRIGREVA